MALDESVNLKDAILGGEGSIKCQFFLVSQHILRRGCDLD
jgi:hypothetical protein